MTIIASIEGEDPIHIQGPVEVDGSTIYYDPHNPIDPAAVIFQDHAVRLETTQGSFPIARYRSARAGGYEYVPDHTVQPPIKWIPK